MLPVLRHEFIDIGEHSEEDIMEYEPLTRIVLRSFKYIYYDKDILVEKLIISVDEIQYEVSEEVFNRIINTLLIYYSSAKKEISEEDIVQKMQELGGKGGKIMTILEKRYEIGIKEGIEEGIEKGIGKGREEERIEIVKGLIREGTETELIAKVTKLSRDQVEEIREEIESK